jgi:hypothetical protein
MYAVSFLNTWNNHPDMTERQPDNTDTAERVSDPREAKDKCLDDFELFAN